MLNIEIIYEDNDLLVINKPAGLIVHPTSQMLRRAGSDGRTKEETLAEWLVQQYPELKEVGEPWLAPSKVGGTNQEGQVIHRPGIVHRLDRETSGVMVIAKTQETFEYLKQQFANRTVHKTYHAVVYGIMPESEGTIDKPIGKSRSDFRRFSAQPGARGTLREAVTHWKELRVLEEGGEKYSYLELKPKTGRTHQLRVHLKALHHPIVCDKLYAPKKSCALGFERLALHARSIELQSKTEGSLFFEAPLPKEFKSTSNC